MALDFGHDTRLRAVMILSEEQRKGVPRDLFALAGRRLEYGLSLAGEGEGRHVTQERMAELSGQIHEVGHDLMVIADAIAAMAQAAEQI